MKEKYFLVIVFIPLVYFAGCREEKPLQELSKDTYSKQIASFVPTKPLGPMKITFKNGDTITVIHNVFSDEKVDSVAITTNIFNAIFDNCHKGRLNINLFSPLMSSDASRYKLLNEITTAYTLHDAGGNKIGANGISSAFCNIPTGSDVSVYSSIYSLFERQKKLINILIVDSILAH